MQNELPEKGLINVSRFSFNKLAENEKPKRVFNIANGTPQKDQELLKLDVAIL